MGSPKYPVMLAKKYEEKRIVAWPVRTEVKLDGVRCLMTAYPDLRTETMSRTGKPFNSVEAIEFDLATVFAQLRDKYPSGIVLDGELTCGSTFKETVGAIKRKSVQAEGAVLNIFDILSVDEHKAGVSNAQYLERRTHMNEFMDRAAHCSSFNLNDAREAYSHEQILDHYQEIFDNGGEGIIVKNPASNWEAKRSWNWMKIKGENTEDLIVIGREAGLADTKYADCLGALVCERRTESGELIEVRVGSGLSDAERLKFWKARLGDEDYITGRTIEVSFHEVTPDGSLRHPVFKSVRIDK
tara:strand:+ start:1997 stop:2893 length:897 start_codon:yes stop_codon:yes gene_type:complete